VVRVYTIQRPVSYAGFERELTDAMKVSAR